jgi:hypothetical protein
MLKLLILLAIPIFLFEGLPLIREKSWKELIAFSILIGVSLVLGVGKIFGMPTPVELLHRIFEPVGRALFNQF